jgi:AbiV family abortive infection protein
MIILTPELLREYCDAAIRNASDLLEEATILFSNGCKARAYFLSVAAIEEIGKALIAFDAQGRNLMDPAVSREVRRGMEDHPSKIRSAFMGWIAVNPNDREAIKQMVDLMIHLQRGREPSMYTDIDSGTGKVRVPEDIIREVAARDCIRLAADSLACARRHMTETKPVLRTRAEDIIYAMKSLNFQKIAKTEDFWWYFITQIESGHEDFAEAVVQYRNLFFSKGRLFKSPL